MSIHDQKKTKMGTIENWTLPSMEGHLELNEK